MTPNTQHWIDLYGAVLEALIKNLENPKDWFARLGLVPGQEGVMALPKKADPAAVQELRDSWARVRRDIKMFGLEASDKLGFEPGYLKPGLRDTLSGQDKVRLDAELAKWARAPWLDARHELELVPVRFKGRDATTALGFFTHYINQAEKGINPAEDTKKVLLAQGINADNFHEHADRLMIKNPWAPDSPGPSSILRN